MRSSGVIKQKKPIVCVNMLPALTWGSWYTGQWVAKVVPLAAFVTAAPVTAVSVGVVPWSAERRSRRPRSREATWRVHSSTREPCSHKHRFHPFLPQESLFQIPVSACVP